MEKLTEQVWTLATTYGIRVVGVLIALFIAWIVAGLVRRWSFRAFQRSKFDETLSRFFSNMARYAILILAIIGVLGVFGISTTSFAAVLAAGALAIGLAFQGTLSNFASGVMLLVFRPFKVGDFIIVSGQMGAVVEIELFTTEMKTPDNRRLIVPNSQIFGAVIENFSHHPIRRVDVPVGVAYKADVDRTREVLERAAKAVPGVLADPPPQIFLAELGASSVDWKIRVWCNTAEFWDVHQATVRAAKAALDDAKISIPFPQMDVHVDGLGPASSIRPAS